ncbi:unnamed protein product [Phytophthora fragariaefolia]|uniref:Unnamed protein product n=1 Tax=Phytophthora fragariaefolia TaxID=1490495 RepID=A0A9W6TNB9_9STRA|nr:unnamed protein product [Phytophthora fragariaefolia]
MAYREPYDKARIFEPIAILEIISQQLLTSQTKCSRSHITLTNAQRLQICRQRKENSSITQTEVSDWAYNVHTPTIASNYNPKSQKQKKHTEELSTELLATRPTAKCAFLS